MQLGDYKVPLSLYPPTPLHVLQLFLPRKALYPRYKYEQGEKNIALPALALLLPSPARPPCLCNEMSLSCQWECGNTTPTGREGLLPSIHSSSSILRYEGGEASGLGEESLMPSMTLVPPGRPRWGGGKATATYPPLPTPSNDQTFSSSPVAPSLLPDISVRIFPPPLSFFSSLSPYRLRARSPLGSAASSSSSSPWWLPWGSLASSASPPPSSSSRLYPS